MWRWMRALYQGWRLAWADANALLEHFADCALEEAEQRALDPQNIDERRKSGHWTRVAHIIAWRTGQDAAASRVEPARRPPLRRDGRGREVLVRH